MSGQLLPPPELEPPVPQGLTGAQCVAVWLDLMDACEAFVRAGLRRRCGPDGDFEAAYRAWNAQEMEEHSAMIIHMLEELDARSRGHAG